MIFVLGFIISLIPRAKTQRFHRIFDDIFLCYFFPASHKTGSGSLSTVDSGGISSGNQCLKMLVADYANLLQILEMMEPIQ